MHRMLLLFSLLPLSAVALYNDNSSASMMPETGIFIPKEMWFGVKAEYICDYIYDLKLRTKHDSTHFIGYQSIGNYGTVAVNFNDRAEIFGTFGSLSFDVAEHLSSHEKISYRVNSHFAWGVGGRVILAYWGDLQLGINAGYLKSDPNVSSVKLNGSSQPLTHCTADLTQWQIGVGISYQFDWFVPYGGIDYSKFRLRMNHLDVLKSLIPSKHIIFKGDQPFGLFIGFGISAHRAFSVNVEARFINENAVSASASMKF